MYYYNSRACILMFDLGSNINNINGHPCQPFKSSPKTREASLGSGIRFLDETTGMREIGAINAAQIEGWKKSVSYYISIGRGYESISP